MRILYILALIACTVTARADLQLTFQVAEKKQGAAPAPNQPPPAPVAKDFTLTVTIGSDYILSVEPEETAAYDFQKKRIHRVDTAKKTYHETRR